MQAEIKSKLIESIDYDNDTRTLKIFMTNGQVRIYLDVPRNLVDGLLKAKSAGEYYMRNIRGTFASE